MISSCLSRLGDLSFNYLFFLSIIIDDSFLLLYGYTTASPENASPTPSHL